MSYNNDTQATLDALATVFFAAATVWLVLAVLYSLSVLLFIRMRARGQLGSIYDADFGRVYLCGNQNNNSNSRRNSNNNNGSNGQQDESQQQQQRRCGSFLCRLYIPMGFLFRRFVMLSRTDEERERHMNHVIRIMTPTERRQAMETLLVVCSPPCSDSNSSIVTTTNNSSTSSSITGSKDKHFCKDGGGCCDARQQQQQGRPSSVNTTIDTDQDACSVDSPIEESLGDEETGATRTVENKDRAQKTAELGANHSRMVAAAVYAASPSSSSSSLSASAQLLLDEEEGPSCSICLAEFDHDVAAAALEAGIAAAEYNVLVSKTCTHQFHVDCIMSWLERGNNIECPCCRVPMVTEDQVWATVKAQRKELQRRKKKQQQKKSSSSIVQEVLARFLQPFDLQRQKRETENNNDNEENMDVTEQSEVSGTSDLPVQEAVAQQQDTSSSSSRIPPPPQPRRPRHLPRSQSRSSNDLLSDATATELPRQVPRRARSQSQQRRLSNFSGTSLSV